MTTNRINDYQYVVETNFKEDLIHVKVGSRFVESDPRRIKSIEALASPRFEYCYKVTMANLEQANR